MHGPRGTIPPVTPTPLPFDKKGCSPASVAMEAEASLEVSAHLGHLPVLSKVAVRPPVIGRVGEGPKR